jgi:23S rRNA (cytidine1920-2'-O)/16S rRNA (cytidine1409-2'-O)-methyltransferase
VRDGVNARSLSAREVPEACSLATLDVSFISVLKILPAVKSVLEPMADVVCLVKPQFEVGRFRVGKGGIVSDPALHRQVLGDIAWSVQREIGFSVLDACASPITGAEGNREFFLHLVPGRSERAANVDALVEKAVGG